jgi:hypothetical protein
LTVGFEDNSKKLHEFLKEKIFRTKITQALKSVAVHADDQHFIFVGENGTCRQFMNSVGEVLTTGTQLFSATAGTIVLEGADEISLTCGPNFIKFTPAGTYINGPMLYLLSGGKDRCEGY